LNQHVHQPVSDPTGTLPLQKKFRRAFDARWNSLKKMIPDAIAARTDAINMITHSMLTGDDSIKAFQNWFDEALRIVVLGGNGTWSMSYVRAAGDHGIYRTKSMLPAYAMPEVDRVPLLQSMCIAEMQGIMEAVSQQAVRTFANGLLLKQSTSAISRDIQRILDTTGKRRTAMLSSFMCVRTFSATTLDTFRAANVLLVGTVPERIALPSPIRDAKAKPPFNHGGLVADAKKKKKIPQNLVEVLTAGDNKVCPICEDISEEGPYTLAEAEGLVPAHINCRCAFIPWVPRVKPFDALLLDKKDKLGHGSYKKGETPFIKPEDKKSKNSGLPNDEDARWNDGTFADYVRKEGKNNALYLSYNKDLRTQGYTPVTPEKFVDRVENEGLRPAVHEGKIIGWVQTEHKKAAQGRVVESKSDKTLQSEKQFKDLFNQSLKTKMTAEQKRAVENYTTGQYKRINGALRQGKELREVVGNDEDVSPKHVQLMLDDMFKKTALAREIKTIRKISPTLYKKMVAGDTYLDKAFVSTTTDTDGLAEEVFDKEGTYKSVHIVLPKGAKALPIAHISSAPDENEVLINRGSKFKVVKTKDSITLRWIK
jgi:hypothetical protein